MKSPFKNAILRAAFFLAAMPAVQGNAHAMERGTVVNHGWEIVWGSGVATAKNLKTGEQRALFASEKSAENEPASESKYEMLSVVGTVVSWSNSWYSEDGAHPSYGTAWSAVNLDPNGSADLADLFGEEAVFTRLMRDVTIQSALNGVLAETTNQPHPIPKNLRELLQYADGGCVARMDASMLQQYYFPYRLGGKIAVVQIGLSHGCEVNRGSFTELARLYFPIPDALRADFDKSVRDGVLEEKPFQEASFNCSKAETSIEFAICTDAGLARLDVEMAKRYKAARRAATDNARKRIKQEQRDWIETRNRRCATPDNEMLHNGEGEFFPTVEACLAKHYETRLAELK